MFGWLKRRRRRKARSVRAGSTDPKPRRNHGAWAKLTSHWNKTRSVRRKPARKRANKVKTPGAGTRKGMAAEIPILDAVPELASPAPPPAPPKQPGIAIYGIFKAPVGIGEAARRGVNALRLGGIPVSTHTIDVASTEYEIPFAADDPAAPAYDTALFYLNPTWGLLDIHSQPLKDRRRIGVWHWELPVLPMQWAAEAAFVDEVWAPSRFIAEMVKAAMTLPVQIVPHPAVVVPINREAARAALGLPQSRRIILTAFDFGSFWARKNPEAVVRAFRDAFPDGGDVPLLLVKCHRNDPAADSERIALLKANPNTVVIDRTCSQEEMRMIYAAADAFVSLHRSEGVGLNILDMMALGRVCVATGFSGNLDFMTHDNSILIPWTMRAVAPHEYPFGTGQWWAEPDHDAAVAAMGWIGTASDSALSALGERARIDTNRDFSPERVGALARAAWTGEKPANGGSP